MKTLFLANDNKKMILSSFNDDGIGWEEGANSFTTGRDTKPINE